MGKYQGATGHISTKTIGLPPSLMEKLMKCLPLHLIKSIRIMNNPITLSQPSSVSSQHMRLSRTKHT